MGGVINKVLSKLVPSKSFAAFEGRNFSSSCCSCCWSTHSNSWIVVSSSLCPERFFPSLHYKVDEVEAHQTQIPMLLCIPGFEK